MGNKLNYSFMAFASGKVSTEVAEVKRYIGVAPVYVKAVNPTKKQLEAIYNTTIENEPSYLSEDENKVKQARIDFVVVTDAEKCGIEMTTKVTFFIKNDVRYNRDKTKIQVINKYGETTWLPIEDAKAGRVPESLSWFEAADFRPAYIGEEELTGFIKAYLNIPNKSYRNANGEVIELENKSDAEARLDCIGNYFKGDFSELKSVIELQPNNKVKVLFGVRTTDDGKQYQTAYIQKFLKNNVSNYSKLEEDVKARKDSGAYPTTAFKVCELEEFTVEASDLNDDMPEAAPAVEMPNWFTK